MESSVKCTEVKTESLVGDSQFATILSIAEDFFGKKIITKIRSEDFVYARMILYKILHDLGYTKVMIGKFVGKDHSTIINALKRFDDYTSYDNDLITKYNILSGRVAEVMYKKNPMAFQSKDIILAKALTLQKELADTSAKLKACEDKLSRYVKYDRLIKTIEKETPDDKFISSLTTKIIRILNT